MAATLVVAIGCNETADPDAMNVRVVTGDATGITIRSATLYGSFTRSTDPIRETGFEWGESEGSLTETLQASVAATPFSAVLDDLGDDKTYYYRAYVILQRGSDIQSFYGEVRSFKTLKQGDSPDPDPPTPPDTPTPDPPTPPDTPTPDPPTPVDGSIGWYELPQMNIAKTGKYYVNASDNSQYYAWHMCAGGEKGPGGKTARNYTVCYSATHHCALWVAAPRHSMYVGSASRSDTYRQDQQIPSDIQYSSKSTGGGCNKGHLLGSAERTSTKATNSDVFYYPNIAPQLSTGFNTGGGGWNTLEDWVDEQVCADTLYEVIGCYFEEFSHTYKKNSSTVTVSQSPKTISYCGRDDVHMPTMFYYALLRTKKGNSGKALKDCSADELKCAAFVRTHSNDLRGIPVTSYDMMSVSDLEKLTGVTYFPNVPAAPKSTATASDWGL